MRLFEGSKRAVALSLINTLLISTWKFMNESNIMTVYIPDDRSSRDKPRRRIRGTRLNILKVSED